MKMGATRPMGRKGKKGKGTCNDYGQKGANSTTTRVIKERGANGYQLKLQGQGLFLLSDGWSHPVKSECRKRMEDVKSAEKGKSKPNAALLGWCYVILFTMTLLMFNQELH